jgi:hypothetical protein
VNIEGGVEVCKGRGHTLVRHDTSKKSGGINNTTDMCVSVSAKTTVSVPPPPPGSPHHTVVSMMMDSMNLTVFTTPLLESRTDVEVQDLIGSDKNVDTEDLLTPYLSWMSRYESPTK